MPTIDASSPQAQVASRFMRDKGYDTEPFDMERLDNQPCWYFYYRLPEGDLELEVYWDGSEWQTTVTVFTLAS